jgi:8-oxo-dGTP pyrophosphatase MutT (NUDIX family)
MEGGRERPACPKEGCRYFHFGDYSIGCGGVVIRDNKGLLIQRGINPNRGAWQIPGGYVEADEEIVDAVEREVLEEAGVVAKVQDVVGVRHSLAGSIGGDETIGAGYFSLEEIAQMDRVQGLSTWAIRRALELPPTEGFAVDRSDDNLTRPGWSLFAPKS